MVKPAGRMALKGPALAALGAVALTFGTAVFVVSNRPAPDATPPARAQDPSGDIPQAGLPAPEPQAEAPAGNAPSPAAGPRGGADPVPGSDRRSDSTADSTAGSAPGDTDQAALDSETTVDVTALIAPPPAPGFGLVRVDEDGFATVSGSAEPGDLVEVLLDGRQAAQTHALPDGSFAALFDVAVTEKAQVLGLRATGPDGTLREAEATVIIAPLLRASPQESVPDPVPALLAALPPAADDPSAPPPAPLSIAAASPPRSAAPAEMTTAQTGPAAPRDTGAAQPARQAQAVAQTPLPQPTAAPAPSGDAPGDGGTTAAALPVDTASAAPQDAAPVPTPATPDAAAPRTATAPTAPADAAAPVRAAGAPALLLREGDGVRVLQPARPDSLRAGVVIDAIGYDVAGRVTVSGRADPGPPPARLRVYLDNAPIMAATAAADGSFALNLDSVAGGDYTLRIDELSPQGRVTSRFETPFRREDPARLADLRAQAPRGDDGAVLPVSAITVQPGYTLWGIADDRYGQGFAYVKIFEANRDKIADPDLIYPGQVFDLPE